MPADELIYDRFGPSYRRVRERESTSRCLSLPFHYPFVRGFTALHCLPLPFTAFPFLSLPFPAFPFLSPCRSLHFVRVFTAFRACVHCPALPFTAFLACVHSAFHCDSSTEFKWHTDAMDSDPAR